MRHRTTVTGVVAVLVLGGGFAGSTAASASPVCAGASTSGSVTGGTLEQAWGDGNLGDKPITTG